jgi:hypothetical protein
MTGPLTGHAYEPWARADRSETEGPTPTGHPGTSITAASNAGMYLVTGAISNS